MQPGTRLTHYEILSALGKGGMGEVWRARDTKLGREVAIKTLPEEFARDADRLARFEREAKLLASLNHPNIAAIYGLEEHEGIRFLVLELVEGDTLADRIARGPIAIEEAIALAFQITEALEAAHDSGVIHRDLKPANVKVTKDGKIKVLDFGLAKALTNDGPDVSISQSPTISIAATQQGMILGTAAYMSPEQARGEEVDAGTDIWSFGCVLFEMLTGAQTFSGTTAIDIIGSVVKLDPDWSLLPDDTPAAIKQLLNRCLRKDRTRRLRHVGDVRMELEELPEDEAIAALTGKTPSRDQTRGLAFGMACLLVLAAWATYVFVSTPQTEVFRFAVTTPRLNGWRPGPGSAISPDDSMLAYVAPNEDGMDVIWVQRVGELEGEVLTDTEGAFLPFWSPDSRSLGFFADQSLKTIEIDGGTARTIADAQAGFGGTWNSDGVIVFSSGFRTTLQQVSAEGGPTAPVTSFAPERADGAHTSPTFLADGRNFIFSMNASPEYSGVYLGSLDSPEVTLLVGGTFGATVSQDGYVLFIDEGVVRAQKLDLDERTLVGNSVTVGEDVRQIGDVYSDAKVLSVSSNHSLTYRRGQSDQAQLTWFDRATGAAVATIGPTGNYEAPVLSPDETRIAVGEDGDIFIIDLTRNNATIPLTSGPTREFYPAWSPDSSEVVYVAGSEGDLRLFTELASGTGEPELLLEPAGALFYWSESGYLTYFRTSPETADDMYVVDMNGDRQPQIYIDTEAGEFEGHVSPDGRWMAYVSDQSGQPEVYVETFPRSDLSYPISSAGGAQPVWRSDGDELFFIGLDGMLMAVDIQTDPEFVAGTPQPLLQTGSQFWAARNSYSPTRDGQRFLVNVDPETEVFRTAIVLNWDALLE